MSISEYQLRSKAYFLKREDEKELLAIASIYNREANHVSEKGRYTVQKLKDLIDVEKAEKQIFNEEEIVKTFDRLHQVVKRAKERK